MKVKFLETRVVQSVDGETFEKDKVYDLPDASAQRWIRRGVAETVEDKKPQPKK